MEPSDRAAAETEEEGGKRLSLSVRRGDRQIKFMKESQEKISIRSILITSIPLL